MNKTIAVGLAGLLLTAAPVYGVQDIWGGDDLVRQWDKEHMQNTTLLASVSASDAGVRIVDGPHEGEFYEWRNAGEDLAGSGVESGTPINQNAKIVSLIGIPKTVLGNADKHELHNYFGLIGPTGIVNDPSIYPYEKKVYPIHVREGDTLEHIAHVLSIVLEIPVTWQDVYRQNKPIIGKNPHHIHPDMDIQYDTGWKERFPSYHGSWKRYIGSEELNSSD